MTAPKHKKTMIIFTQYSPTFPKLEIANLLYSYYFTIFLDFRSSKQDKIVNK